MKITNEKGAILGIVLVFILALTVFGYGLMRLCELNAIEAARTSMSNQAFWIAEAGLARVIAKLADETSSTYRDNPTTVTDTESFSDGEYTVDVEKNTVHYTVTSTGTVGTIDRTIQRDIIVALAPDGFRYTAYSPNDIKLNNADNGFIEGDIAAGGEVDGEEGWTTDGMAYNGVNIFFPTCNFDGPSPSYKSLALSHVDGHVESGDFTFQSGQTYSGIYYIEVNAIIQSNVTINGSIIADGTVDMGDADGATINPAAYDPDAGWPAIAAKGDINVKDKSGAMLTVVGLVYTEGKFHMLNATNCTFNGTILAEDGMLHINNTENVSLIYNIDILENPPPYFDDGQGGTNLVVYLEDDWQEIPD